MSTAPGNNTEFNELFCRVGARPDIIDGMLRLLLIEHFSSADNVEVPFKERLFADDETSKILIEEATVWKPEETGLRPAVIIKENEWQPIKRATFDSQSSVSAEGFKQYVKFWQGSHTLFCLAKEGSEVKLLAAEVYQFLSRFSPVYRSFFGLLSFDVAQVGATHTIKESSNHLAKPVTVAYSWCETITITTTEPRITSIRLSELFNLGQ